MRKELHRLCDMFGADLGCIYLVTAIVVGRMSDVPTIDAVWRPGALGAWCFMHHYLGALRRQRRRVIIEGSVELCFGGDVQIDC